MGRILIVDDEPQICRTLESVAVRMGHQVASTNSLAQAFECIWQQKPDLLLLDVHLPDGNGISALKEFMESSSRPEVIIMTGIGDGTGAELAIKNGAWNYLEKPISAKDLKLHIERALDYHEKKASHGQVRSLKRCKIIGNSRVVANCLDQVAQCATKPLNVLITGETGTGKELFARTIHDNCDRAQSPFIVVDCAALPEHLVESILFGHEKGAFTGADSSRQGLVKAADGGTLFLDEIGELPLSIQKSLLRVLQERKFRPVGSTKEIESDFRLISATNRNLDTMVEAGTFRTDLMYRIKTAHIHLPALRDRKQDIPELADFFVRQACRQMEKKNMAVVSDVIDILKCHDWPGNVRELKSTMEQAVVSQGYGDVLFPVAIADHLRIRYIQSKWTTQKREGHCTADKDDSSIRFFWTPPHSTDEIRPFKEVREAMTTQVERDYLCHLAKLLDGDFKQISEYSGLGRSRLYHLFSKHDISLN